MNNLLKHALKELTNIIDEIEAEDDVKYFEEDDALELYDNCIYLMEEFMKDNTQIITDPDFDDIFDDNIKELMNALFEDDLFYNDDAEDELDEIILEAKTDFFKDHMPPRSYPDARILEVPDYDYIKEQLDILRNKPQPTQRTKEWYQFRHNLITASNAYKAFESQATKNQLIYEKCQPLNNAGDDSDAEEEIKLVNVNSTLHWGQKYEPVSVLFYEHEYNTKVEDFGCIQDDEYHFLGASPDGIITDINSQRYGRMLEIKNIVNREIDGIPKKEYWIQMQLQMKVCELEECDFLETKFVEYMDRHAFEDDTNNDVYEDEKGLEFKNVCISKDSKTKGIILYFHTKEGKPHYVYKPLDIIHPHDIIEWEDKMLDLYQSAKYNYLYIKYLYWKLDHVSCVLVCRNRQWFENAAADLQDIWTTIETERVSGFEHRAPNRKTKKVNAFDLLLNKQNNTTGCLLNFNKITIIKNEITVTIDDDISETSESNETNKEEEDTSEIIDTNNDEPV
jgi:putative phage-type endonuclease